MFMLLRFLSILGTLEGKAEKEGETMFQGFNEETLAFLWGIRFNNERDWFLAHKQDYQSFVNEPLKALGQEVYEELHAAFPKEELFCKLSRIYRDARRLFGRGPYKDHMWFCIRRAGDAWEERPTFWFEISPEGYSYGMGFYAAKASTMAEFRRELDAEPQRFLKIARALAKQKTFTLTGEDYARKKGEAEGLLARWYNKKNIAMECTRSYDELSFSPALKDELVRGFSELMPLYRYFEDLSRRIEK